MESNDLTTIERGITTREGLNPVLDLFERSQGGTAPATRDLYRRTVAAFFDWVASTGRTINALTIADLVAYTDDLTASGKSSLTIAGYINSLRRFYKWTEANKIYPNIAAGLKAPKRRNDEFKHKPLGVAKVGELLRFEATTSPRDYAIINLMVRTGLRCVEVVRANIGDITYLGEDNTRVLMVQGKGHTDKDDYVILTDAAYLPIRDYLKTRPGEPTTAPLFASTSNHTAKAENHTTARDYDPRRLSTRAVSGIAKNGLKNVGLDDKLFTAHSLRHTAGTNVLRAGGSIEQAQQMLRHANPATTEIYVKMALKERRLTDGGENLLDKIYQGVTA